MGNNQSADNAGDNSVYVNSVNKFASTLLKEMCNNKQLNVIASPLSVHNALLITASATDGDSFAELLKILNFPSINSSTEVYWIYLTKDF